MSNLGNQPAYSRPGYYHSEQSFDGDCSPQDGMTIRTRAAIAAMQGMLANPENLYNQGDLEEEAIEHADLLVARLEAARSSQPEPASHEPG